MSGDWIKMRDNLWDDPRVAKMVDMTDSSEAAIIGALYWLWATADQHTHDGCMPGLTLRAIDRKTGVKGFGEALISVGWLKDDPEGVVIIDFEKHNGTSAKKRLETAKRVANHRVSNADVTQSALQNGQTSVTGALPRERIREREEKKTGGESASERALPDPAQHPADAGPPPPDPSEFRPEYREVIAAQRPDLAGTAQQVWLLFCEQYPQQKRGLARWTKWVINEKAAGQGVPAGGRVATADPLADPDSLASVEALGLSLGLGRWDGMKEPFVSYKNRVRTTALEGEKCT
jgi:hypothetical protein